ncbi:MAG: hypothetical protein AAF639_22945 [Chloroflexota bacterium]
MDNHQEHHTKRTSFQPRQYVQREEVRLFIGFFVILYLVGGGLIWFFYGLSAMFLGMACMTGGLLFFLLLYGLMALLGYLVSE